MGALTLKSFPFELRGWDIEKFESIDPTDGFGTNTRIYVNKDQVIQVEPDYDINNFNTWLTNRGRQFFDGIFNTEYLIKKEPKGTSSNMGSLEIIFRLTKILYLFDCINQKKNKKYFFTVIFDNLGIETLSLLNLISKKFLFFNVKRVENVKINNDLEFNFQLNTARNKVKLNSSTLCLLISTNTRNEGYYLNLNLRHRFLKGNFKCLVIGSLLNITFPTTFIGSNVKVLKTISEGTNIVCQEFKTAKNPLLVLNSEMFKRRDGNNLLEMFKYSNSILNKTLFNFNTLTPSLSEGTVQTLNKFEIVTKNDLSNFSSLYFLNITADNLSNLKQISEYKLLNYKTSLNKITNIEKVFIDQSYKYNKNLLYFNKISLKSNYFIKYSFLQNSNFYENEETFINTEGSVKRTNKLIFQKKTRNSWQILRKLFKQLSSIRFVNQKTNQIIFFNFKKLSYFKNFIYFHYQATQALTHMNFYLTLKTNPFFFNKKYINFKTSTKKIINSKLKYWLNDFFIGSKDEYSQNSLILSGCSKILRHESTNFF